MHTMSSMEPRNNQNKGSDPGNKKGAKIRAACLFAAYLAVLFYLLFFSKDMGRTPDHMSYNLIPLSEISRYLRYWRSLGLYLVLMNLCGNILAFVPFGYLLPVLLDRWKGLLPTLVGSFIFSLIVETIQLFTRVGSFDVDDIILNTIGGVIGYLIYLLAESLQRKIDHHTQTIEE